jgi:hypothetical protein
MGSLGCGGSLKTASQDKLSSYSYDFPGKSAPRGRPPFLRGGIHVAALLLPRTPWVNALEFPANSKFVY